MDGVSIIRGAERPRRSPKAIFRHTRDAIIDGRGDATLFGPSVEHHAIVSRVSIDGLRKAGKRY